jgi:hypothetical protein
MLGSYLQGTNPMAERNYPCDDLIIGVWGKAAGAALDEVGELAFKRQLFQCMLAQALFMKGDIEGRRSGSNAFGLLTWQLNESKSAVGYQLTTHAPVHSTVCMGSTVYTLAHLHMTIFALFVR